ncbi:histone H1-I [Drosophila virilis]|uniref:Uncharacterized protein n=1 Tax=Drosophila virilis TaxID=7244 RepID=B4LTI3_DROVI|nr:uncharacterized protein LOC6628056 [Drosophila virilis]EDW63953.1 uncharacterized protein Dvir_GJ17192 [Drosophila virilis]
MEEPVVSIYDMLMKRHRQQRKEECQQQRDLLQNRRPTQDVQTKPSVDSSIEPKKPRARISRTRFSVDPMQSGVKMSASVVTSAHLTKKKSNILPPSHAKKETLNQLVEKMSGFSRKRLKNAPAEPLPVPEKSVADHTTRSRDNSTKKRTGMRNKPKVNKTPPGSESINQRPRLALSPRNTNRLANKPAVKREKAKANPNEPKVQRRAKNSEAVRPKARLRVHMSKLSIKSASKERKIPPPADNAVHYRL